MEYVIRLMKVVVNTNPTHSLCNVFLECSRSRYWRTISGERNLGLLRQRSGQQACADEKQEKGILLQVYWSITSFCHAIDYRGNQQLIVSENLETVVEKRIYGEILNILKRIKQSISYVNSCAILDQVSTCDNNEIIQSIREYSSKSVYSLAAHLQEIAFYKETWIKR